MDWLLDQGSESIPSVRDAALHFGQGAFLRLLVSPVTGLMPETQAVNVSDKAVRAESGPLLHLPPFFFFLPFSLLSLIQPLSSPLFITEPDVPSLCYF